MVQIFVEHWGNNLQSYPNFALFSTLGGMNLDHAFYQVSKLSEEQKKRSLPKWNTFFPQNQVETYAQMHTRVKLLKGIQSNYWGEVSLRVSALLILKDPRFGATNFLPNFIFPLYLLVHPKIVMCLAYTSKKSEFWHSHLRGIPVVLLSNFVKFRLFIFDYFENFISPG